MRRLAAVAALVAGLASPAAATTAVQMSTESMSQAADAIVLGRAVEQRSQWVGRNLVTLVTVAVEETLKGDAAERLVVALPGGVDASRRIPVAMSWPAAPVVRPKEQVFLFLVASDEVEGGYAIVGFSQGKFSVSGEGADRTVSRDLTGLNLLGRAGLTRGTRSIQSLDAFRAEVLRGLAAARE
jgi:hypothetical protein